MDLLCETHLHKTYATAPSGKRVHMLTTTRDVQVVHQIPYQLEMFCECGAPMSYYETDKISAYLKARGHNGKF